MRVLLPIFLAFTMITSTVVSAVLQMQNSVVCETKETKGDDTDPETEKEDKSETEKELINAKNLCVALVENLLDFDAKTKHFLKDETCISSLYIFLPENPPEA